eukprot:6474071-Amphidinium_carterae.2
MRTAWPQVQANDSSVRYQPNAIIRFLKRLTRSTRNHWVCRVQASLESRLERIDPASCSLASLGTVSGVTRWGA